MSYDPRTDELPEELPDVLPDDGEAPRQHGPRDDPNMRDGDSGHGNPHEYPPPEYPTSDSDTGDVEDEPIHAGIEGGAIGGTPAEMRSDVNSNADDESFTPEPEAGVQPMPEAFDEAHKSSDATPSSEPELPIEDYRNLTVKQIAERAEDLSPEDMQRIRDYETSHLNRKTLVTKLNRLLAGGGRRKQESGMRG